MTVVAVRAARAMKTPITATAMAGGTNYNQLKALRGSGRNSSGRGSGDGGNRDVNSNIN
jgi:hypothetical protein